MEKYKQELTEVENAARAVFSLTNKLMSRYEAGDREWQLFYQVFRLANVAVDICTTEKGSVDAQEHHEVWNV